MLFHRDLAENLNVCNHCGHHMKITIKERLALIFDDSKYERLAVPSVPQDPLKFKDKKNMLIVWKMLQSKTREKDAIVVAFGMVGGNPTVVAAFNFALWVVRWGLLLVKGLFVQRKWLFREVLRWLPFPASGGARMQEGMVSLIQLPRSVVPFRWLRMPDCLILFFWPIQLRGWC